MAKIYRIRKLTPRECGRLMGCSDADLDRMIRYPYRPDENGEWTLPKGVDEQMAKKMRISESQLYKCFGNSIVVQVLEGIFTQLLRADGDCLF
jgi:DNA (cytosine-5)-methyltransferase 1